MKSITSRPHLISQSWKTWLQRRFLICTLWCYIILIKIHSPFRKKNNLNSWIITQSIFVLKTNGYQPFGLQVPTEDNFLSLFQESKWLMFQKGFFCLKKYQWDGSYALSFPQRLYRLNTITNKKLILLNLI
jgi:hypothetical protein